MVAVISKKYIAQNKNSNTLNSGLLYLQQVIQAQY